MTISAWSARAEGRGGVDGVSTASPLYTWAMGVPSADFTEYLAATTTIAWADLTAREQLRVIGPDRVSFVHGMVTNDITGLAEGASCPVAMLTAGAFMTERAGIEADLSLRAQQAFERQGLSWAQASFEGRDAISFDARSADQAVSRRPGGCNRARTTRRPALKAGGGRVAFDRGRPGSYNRASLGR